MDDPVFSKSLIVGYLMMLDGPTRRSIITTVAHCNRKDLTKYVNQKWIVRHLGSYDYEVTDRKTETQYLVKGYGGWVVTDPISWSVYKKKERGYRG